MSASNIAKSQSLIRGLKDQLSKRLSSSFLVESLGPAGDTLMISQSSTPTAGQSNAAVRVGFQDTQFQDVIGSAQAVYSPMKAQIIEEATAASASVSLVSLAFQLALNMELDKMGIKQDWYLNANGTVPAISQFNNDGTVSGSTLQLSIAPDSYWPLSGQ